MLCEVKDCKGCDFNQEHWEYPYCILKGDSFNDDEQMLSWAETNCPLLKEDYTFHKVV